MDAWIIAEALGSPIRDFEDAVQYHTALRSGVDVILTRDIRDYRRSEIPVLTPAAFIARNNLV